MVQIVLQPTFGTLIVELSSTRNKKKQVVPEHNIIKINLQLGGDWSLVKSLRAHRYSPSVCPFVRVKFREETSELEQHGDAAAV